MVLDKIPGTQVFTQRDVRETPASTATATAVGLTDLNYILISTDADTTRDRVITAGEGIDFDDAGAKSTFTIKGEDASTTNKGIAKFSAGAGIDVSVSSGDVTYSGESASLTNAGIVELATIAETQTGTSETLAVPPNSLFEVLPPIGAIVAWLKSFTNTPQTLPTGWVECDGTAINDAASVYNGQNSPDLNGNEFVRGAATSGSTGGGTSDDPGDHQHSFSDSDTINISDTSNNAVGDIYKTDNTGSFSVTRLTHNHTISDSDTCNISGTTGADGSHTHSTIEPKYYDVVWIMRIK